jgi:phenylacetate-CoA ligase
LFEFGHKIYKWVMLIKTLSNQFYVIRSLLRHPDVSRDEIVAFQNKQLRRLISHAYENVPYYRRLFDQNRIKPKDIQSVADLSIIPLTSKKDLQGLPSKELVARGVTPKELIARSTSGSSGERLTIRRTWLEERLLSLFRLRAMHYFGQKTTDKLARIGLLRTTDPRDNQLPLRILNTFHLYRSEQINCLIPVEDIVPKLRHINPDILTGFPGVLSQLAQIVDAQDDLVIRPRFVRTNSEVLTPLMRHQIGKAFACPVFDYYSSYEFRVIAWECKETGELHTCDDSIIIEIMKDGRPAARGERGEVVGTNLHSFAMPFIRYRLGDIVTKGFETCRCGQPFSTIRAIQGRMLDYFPLPGGRMIHPYEISLLYLASNWIRQYQLTQEREDRVVLRVVPHRTPTIQELAQLEESVIAVLGQGVEFQVILVPEIRLEPTGKFRVSRSLVRSAYDGIDWEKPETGNPRPIGSNGKEPD